MSRLSTLFNLVSFVLLVASLALFSFPTAWGGVYPSLLAPRPVALCREYGQLLCILAVFAMALRFWCASLRPPVQEGS